MAQSLHQALLSGAAALNLKLSAQQTERLADYLALIQKWNKVYNLTALRDPAEQLTHHALDSLAVINPLQRYLAHSAPKPRRCLRVLDVGSGAGLPGVVMAICCPDLLVCCVDAVAKKAAFIQQVALALKLAGLQGMHARVENLASTYDLVCSRAFASLSDFTRWSRHTLAPGGVWMAMKGKHPQDELAALPADVTAFHVEQLTVPGLAAQRCLVWLRPVDSVES